MTQVPSAKNYHTTKITITSSDTPAAIKITRAVPAASSLPRRTIPPVERGAKLRPDEPVFVSHPGAFFPRRGRFAVWVAPEITNERR